MKAKVCARCNRSPVGIHATVRTIAGKGYCLGCAIALEDEGQFSAPASGPAAQFQSRTSSASPYYYCTQCHTHTNTAKMKGNGWIEVLLYLFYILPGVIYSVWRRSGMPNGCPTCGHATLIPAGAVESRREKLIAVGVVGPETHVKCPDCAEFVRREARKCKHCGCGLIPQ